MSAESRSSPAKIASATVAAEARPQTCAHVCEISEELCKGHSDLHVVKRKTRGVVEAFSQSRTRRRRIGETGNRSALSRRKVGLTVSNFESPVAADILALPLFAEISRESSPGG